MDTSTDERVRFLFKRGMGLTYLLGFLVAVNQFQPLLGAHGLLPAVDFIRQIHFVDSPSLFYYFHSDRFIAVVAWIGVFLSSLAVVGLSDRYSSWFSITVWSLLWALYLSFVNVGQVFYGFGWETLLLEAGFYTIFLGPDRVAPPTIMIWILRWLLFRLMFGAGLIKLRGDPCWRDLSCLNYHYETQPMPSRWSWYFHWAPEWTHRAGVVVNHLVEVIVPFGYIGPRVVRLVAGLSTIGFQTMIMISGNLSWLNFLAIVLAISLLDDRFLNRWFPSKPLASPTPAGFQAAAVALALLVAVLSVAPVRNLLSPNQQMNTDYNPLHLVGSYGAFGSVTRARDEVIVEGTEDPVVTPETVWKEYEFYGKPGDLSVQPSQIAPYHLRLGWLLWFAAMSSVNDHPWFVHLMAKLLQGDSGTLSLIKVNPFPLHPPRYIRADLYEYHFATPQERRATGQWWTRKLVAHYFPPLSLDNPMFHRLLDVQGWL